MFKNILIATDGSELAWKAVEQGIALAKSVGARVTVVTVSPPFHIFTLDPMVVEDTADQYTLRMQEHAARLLSGIASAAESAGVACDTVHFVNEHPYRAIIDAAASRGCDLITMASHGRRGVSALLLGSETVKVLTHSKIPVLVHR
jgi:nucleotide-binding universal stress UspA family protein